MIAVSRSTLLVRTISHIRRHHHPDPTTRTIDPTDVTKDMTRETFWVTELTLPDERSSINEQSISHEIAMIPTVTTNIL
ncbi:unnamed protein product [Spirodela intermedia]|uniref:Uncharacterized protein n=1 Tax=Spirodela intermedia TaxID=51605 RepID=A0A7I8LMP1_SPIIN|nr:unnamed protein product [Spirodela intermedia]